jgi:hypothetical protein
MAESLDASASTTKVITIQKQGHHSQDKSVSVPVTSSASAAASIINPSSSSSSSSSYSNIPTIPIQSHSFKQDMELEKLLHLQNQMRHSHSFHPMGMGMGISHSYGHNGILFNLTEKLTKKCEDFMKQFVKDIIEEVRQTLEQGKTPEEIAEVLKGLNTIPSAIPIVNPYNFLSASDYMPSSLGGSQHSSGMTSSPIYLQKIDVSQKSETTTEQGAEEGAEQGAEEGAEEESDNEGEEGSEDDGIEDQEEPDDEELKEISLKHPQFNHSDETNQSNEINEIKRNVEEMEVITEEFNGQKVYIPLEEPFFIYKREVDEDDNLSYFGDLVGVLDSDDIVWNYDGEEHYYCSGDLIGTDDDKFEKLHKNPDLEEVIREKRGASIRLEPDTKEPIWGGYQEWNSIKARKSKK